MKITLEIERECKHSQRYAETGTPEKQAVGTMYVKKSWLVEQFGKLPAKLVIDIEEK